MVKPSWPVRAVLIVGLGLTGCSAVPKSRLDECHQRSQTLQAENSRLKDQLLGLRTENQDLAQRAVDDGRRLKVQDEALQRLEQSVQAYQDERDKLDSAFRKIKRQVQASADLPPDRDR